ncbi:DUF6801 domain-containing protein [Amycolatopsis anabasis]|uniref:DUF6801 domain-containing protein n=1 Tax=Amycolatopsis anabasis TaxID=1840409 RepID=UPI00131CB186|nr:DUF6801 domain-containing protein [Amycolatopsis anabasis]
MKRKSRRRAAIAATAWLAGTATGLLQSGIAHAATDQLYQTNDLQFTCNYPLIGEDSLVGRVQFRAPRSVPTGWSGHPTEIVATGIVPANVVQLMYNVGGIDGIRGATGGDVNLTNASPSSAGLALRFGEYFVTDPDSGPLTVIARQEPGTIVPDVTAGQPGAITIRLDGQFTVAADFHFVNATPAWQPQGEFACVLNAGQDDRFFPDMAVTPATPLGIAKALR